MPQRSFNKLYTNPHGSSKHMRVAYGATTSFLISYTNPHGGTKPYKQSPTNYTLIIFNIILHLMV